MSWNDTTRKNILGKKLQLCWDCEKATGGCSWSEKDKAEPIPGWDAEPDVMNSDTDREVQTFRIYYCPQFVQSKS